MQKTADIFLRVRKKRNGSPARTVGLGLPSWVWSCGKKRRCGAAENVRIRSASRTVHKPGETRSEKLLVPRKGETKARRKKGRTARAPRSFRLNEFIREINFAFPLLRSQLRSQIRSSLCRISVTPPRVFPADDRDQ